MKKSAFQKFEGFKLTSLQSLRILGGGTPTVGGCEESKGEYHTWESDTDMGGGDIIYHKDSGWQPGRCPEK